MKKFQFFVILVLVATVSNAIASKPFVSGTCGVPALLGYKVLAKSPGVNAEPMTWVAAILEGQRGGSHVADLGKAFELAFQAGKPLAPAMGAPAVPVIGPRVAPSASTTPAWVANFQGADPLRFTVADYLRKLRVASPPNPQRLYSFASVEGKGVAQKFYWSAPRIFAEGEDALIDTAGNVIGSVNCGNPCKDLGRDAPIAIPTSMKAPSCDKKADSSSDSGSSSSDDDEEEARPRRRRQRNVNINEGSPVGPPPAIVAGVRSSGATCNVTIMPDGTVIEGGK